MEKEFQSYVLAHFCRQDSLSGLMTFVEPNIFTLKEHQIIFSLIKQFFISYATLPIESELRELSNDYLKQKKIDEDTTHAVKMTVIHLFKLEMGNPEYVKDRTVEFIQKSSFIREGTNILDKVIQNNDIKGLNAYADKVRQIAEFEKQLAPPEFSLLASQFTGVRLPYLRGTPLKFPSLNKQLSAKGAVPGQIFIILSGPKAGKTTTMINLASDLMIQGKKVLYVDTENGEHRIKRLFYQNLTNCTAEELYYELLERSGVRYNTPEIQGLLDSYLSRGKDPSLKAKLLEYYDDINVLLKNKMELIAHGGGELILFSQFTQKTTNDLNTDIKRLYEYKGIKPDALFLDQLDDLAPVRPSLKGETYNDLKKLYKDLKVFLDENGIFCFTPSQINREGFGREKPRAQDIAGAFSKNADADFTIALFGNEVDISQNRRWLSIILARDGKADAGDIALKVDLDRVQIDEEVIPQNSLNRLDSVGII